MSIRGNKKTLLLLRAGEYRIIALLRECGMVNEPRKYVVEKRLELGGEEVFSVPQVSEILVRNDVSYDVVVSIINSEGGLVHAEILPAKGSASMLVWPGNYTVVANPVKRPSNYVGPLTGLRWVSAAELVPGERVALEIEPAPETVLEIYGPPGARVVIKWGTASAIYTIPPNGVLKLGAATIRYSISSCPTDIFHSCWDTTFDAGKSSEVLIQYGIRADTLAGMALVTSVAVALTYLAIKKALTRTGRGETAAPP